MITIQIMTFREFRARERILPVVAVLSQSSNTPSIIVAIYAIFTTIVESLYFFRSKILLHLTRPY